MNAQDSKRLKTVDEVSKLLEINVDYQKAVFWKMSLPLDTLIGNTAFETATIPIFTKCNAAILHAFNKIHMYNDLMKKVAYINKGST